MINQPVKALFIFDVDHVVIPPIHHCITPHSPTHMVLSGSPESNSRLLLTLLLTCANLVGNSAEKRPDEMVITSALDKLESRT